MKAPEYEYGLSHYYEYGLSHYVCLKLRDLVEYPEIYQTHLGDTIRFSVGHPVHLATWIGTFDVELFPGEDPNTIAERAQLAYIQWKIAEGG